MIAVRQLFVEYRDGRRRIPALTNLSITFRPNELCVLLGANGSGKSTLLKAIAGLLPLREGRIEVATEDDHGRACRVVGLVFEEPAMQIVSSVVEEDLLFGLENLGVTPAEAEERIERTLSRLDILHLRFADASHLSSGERQLVALAGQLVLEPRFLLSDESTAHLDPRHAAEVFSLLLELAHADGIGVIHATHVAEEAAAADRIIVLTDGAVDRDGSPDTVFAAASSLRQAGVPVPPTAIVSERLKGLGFAVPHPVLSPGGFNGPGLPRS